MNSYNFPTKDFNKRQNPVKLTRREVLTIDYSPVPSLLAWFGASAIHPLFANLVVGFSIKNSISVIISISISTSIRIQLYIHQSMKNQHERQLAFQLFLHSLPSWLAPRSPLSLHGDALLLRIQGSNHIACIFQISPHSPWKRKKVNIFQLKLPLH